MLTERWATRFPHAWGKWNSHASNRLVVICWNLWGRSLFQFFEWISNGVLKAQSLLLSRSSLTCQKPWFASKTFYFSWPQQGTNCPYFSFLINCSSVKIKIYGHSLKFTSSLDATSREAWAVGLLQLKLCYQKTNCGLYKVINFQHFNIFDQLFLHWYCDKFLPAIDSCSQCAESVEQKFYLGFRVAGTGVGHGGGDN